MVTKSGQFKLSSDDTTQTVCLTESNAVCVRFGGAFQVGVINWYSMLFLGGPLHGQ